VLERNGGGGTVCSNGYYFDAEHLDDNDLVARLRLDSLVADQNKPLLLVVAGTPLDCQQLAELHTQLVDMQGEMFQVVTLPCQSQGWVFANGVLRAMTCRPS